MTAPAVAPTEHLVRPRLAAGVEVHPPVEQGASWIVQRGESQYFRIGADLAVLASSLDGERDAGELAVALGAPWTALAVADGVGLLERSDLIWRPDHRDRTRTRRVRFVLPLTVQFALLMSSARVAAAVERVLAPVRRPVTALLLLLGVTGVLGLVVRRSLVTDALGTPTELGVLFSVLVAVALTTAVHELAHACVLHRHGGRPGRLGIMLFYLSPAFFCDVSDAWRLRHGAHRAQVALAGVTVQFGIGGAAATVAAVAPGLPCSGTLVLFAVITLGAAAVNLVPFVKLDGYLALMSHLDWPNLRADAMRSVRTAVVGWIGGRRWERGARWAWWLPLFGLACIATPIVIVVRALSQWLDVLLSLGLFGMCFSVALGGLVTALLVKGLLALAADVRAVRPRPLRVTAVGLALVAGVVALGSVPMSTGVAGGFRVLPGGAVQLVTPAGSGAPVVHAGDRVELFEAGPVLRRPVGSGVILPGPTAQVTVPLSVLLPVRADQVPASVVARPVAMDAAPLVTQGTAVIGRRMIPLRSWVYDRFVAPIVSFFD